MAILAATGGRDFADKEFVWETLDFCLGYYNVHRMVVGDAKGADALVFEWCEEAEIPCQRFEADWKTYGLAAGMIRNGVMLSEKPDYLVAFPGGTGTNGCVKEAKKRWIPVIDHRYRH